MGLKRISDEVKGINRNMQFLRPHDNPTMCKWIEEYLRRIKHINTTINSYTVTIVTDESFLIPKHKMYRLLAYTNDLICYDLTLHNFKKFCRKNKLSSSRNLIVKNL